MVGNRCVPVISGVRLVLCHSDLYFSFGFSDVLLFAKFACYKIDNISCCAVSSQCALVFVLCVCAGENL